MRHHRHTVRFGRQTSHYKATLRHLVRGLIINKSISTTKVKAKETSRLADRLVTLGKDNTVTSQRRAYSVLQDRGLVKILFNEIAPLFKERKGGYTRVMLTGRRNGDNAQMSILEFVERPKPLKKEKKKKEGKIKEKPIKVEPGPKVEKTLAPEKPKKEAPVKKKEPKKVSIEPVKEPERPEKPKERPKEEPKKPGFFKRFFGKK